MYHKVELGSPSLSDFAMGMFNPKMLLLSFYGYPIQKTTVRLVIFIWNILLLAACGFLCWFIMDPYQIILWTPPEGGGGPDWKKM